MVSDNRPMTESPVVTGAFPDDVEVVIVAHNSRAALPATLEALSEAGCPADRVLVMDVASSDGTPDWLTERHPRVRLRRLDRNDGPNPGRNLGIADSSRRFVFLLDADVRVRPDTVQRLHAAMIEDPAVKVGSPIVVHADRPDVIQYAGGALHYICEAINVWGDRALADRGRQPCDIGAAPACGLLIDRDAAIAVGLFDERYFMGKDDGDFIHRMRIAGHRIREVPDALVLHQSRPRGTWLFYYQIRNRWHFMLKNYQWRTLLLILPCLLIHEPLQLAVLHVKGHGRVYWKAVGGLVALLPNLPRDRARVARTRAVPDRLLLRSEQLMIRDDLLRSPVARLGRRMYEGFLSGYWRLITHTVLAG
jgi:GT2 family glycosyltransferase